MRPFRSWRAGRRSALAGLFTISFVVFALAGPAWAQKGKGKGGKKRPDSSASPSASAGDQSLTNIPLPIGHEAKGLVLPDFDLEGHLRGKFIAGSARRLDEEHVAFKDLKITTFTPEDQIDLQIDMHTSVFNLKTKILNTKEPGTIKRADFNIVGDTLEFDTDKRTGHMVGHVKMVITSNSQLIEKSQK
jgi:hypothetical protein